MLAALTTKQLAEDTVKLQEPVAAEPEISAVPVSLESKAAAAPELETYKVTAYYLNVRVSASADSKIVKVVEQGTTIEVKGTTPNGWMELSGGGYVHGNYVVPVEEQPEPSVSAAAVQDAPVRIASVSDVLVKRAVSLPDDQPDASNPAKPTLQVKSDSGLTEEHIAQLFEGTDLEGHGLEQAVLEIEEEYGINAYFTIAVMKLESGNGESKLAKNKNNLFGLNATSSTRASSFETKSDSVRTFGQILSENYVGKGYTTIDKVARKYCPSNPKWANLVYTIMKRDYKKL
ncbi:glucosaminidase domain-containing protein [Paenibacillus protaetiae]|uniref:glucosaminidase domain-containing protein n=1 Tax=Paenibacillus protaetiae TaxID=2509456 RepID=UPI0013ED8A93|nr:glucosaminidase domain-containing protein [Paenibacillus protaetiae]